MRDPSDMDRRRENMVAQQIARRGITDRRLLEAMRRTPREAFVPESYQEIAFADGPLPIGEDQTISQPYIVAIMAEAASIQPHDRVLEVGTGSGYAAAVFAKLASHVYTIERHPNLAAQARQTLQALGFHNVSLRTGDGTLGWPEAAPFDAIIVAASGPRIPQSLKSQLATGGRLVMPVGDLRPQSLIKLTRCGPETYDKENLGLVQFVPLVGEEAWSDLRNS